MKLQKQTKLGTAPIAMSKKSPSRKAKHEMKDTPPSLHRAIEDQFIAEHPEAFDPFVEQWVVLEGTSIVAHGVDAAVVIGQARAAGVAVPLVFWVEPKLKANQGRLGL